MSLSLLIAAILVLLCVFANRIFDKLGIPALLLFIGVGMLAGIDGVGKIRFYDAKLSNHIGTVALIFILFSGGLQARWNEIKPILWRGTLLATLGVLLTAIILFICIHYILQISVPQALLLSVIVSSTDAPAVFNIFRTQPCCLPPKVRTLVEFESGSNDPMAVLLSISAITLLINPHFSGYDFIIKFCLQIGVGFLWGVLLGKGAAYLLTKFKLAYISLYPVFGVGMALLAFSFTELAYGNGFLAVYITGITMGNSSFHYRRHLIRFQDSLAWIFQIGMFLILGLFVNPSALGKVFFTSLFAAIFLMFIARPLAVFICMYKSSFSTAEKVFISWAGLKGAVPIILATYPLIEKFPKSQLLFNVIFFLVIISVLLQGYSLPYLAKKLKLLQR